MSNARAAIALSGSAAKGMRVAMVVAAFNRHLTARLLKSAQSRLRQLGLKKPGKVLWVPGAFELGVTAQELAFSQQFDAVICLGAVIRGETNHYDLVCKGAADGVLQAGMKSRVPCIFGVITCENEEQALARCGGGPKDSGRHAAEAAVHMAKTLKGIRHGRQA